MTKYHAPGRSGRLRTAPSLICIRGRRPRLFPADSRFLADTNHLQRDQDCRCHKKIKVSSECDKPGSVVHGTHTRGFGFVPLRARPVPGTAEGQRTALSTGGGMPLEQWRDVAPRAQRSRFRPPYHRVVTASRSAISRYWTTLKALDYMDCHQPATVRNTVTLCAAGGRHE
jgi:hypothetical protein